MSGIRGLIVDITERKQTEKALQASEEKHRIYVEHAPLSIFVVDGKGKYISVNPDACALLGYTKNELLQLSISDVSIHEEVGEVLGRDHHDGVGL